MGIFDWLFGKKKETAAADERNKPFSEADGRVPVSRKPVIEEYDPAEFEIQGTVLVKHQQLPGKTVVVIPKGVTEIGAFAFSNCNVKKITVPDTVKVIRKYGLHVGSKLKEIFLLGEDVVLEEYAFGYFDGDVYAIEGSKTWGRLERRESRNYVKLHGYVADADDQDNGLFAENGATIKKAPKVKFPSHLVVPSVFHGKKITKIEDLKGLNNVRILEFSEGIEQLYNISGCGNMEEVRFPSTLKEIIAGSFCDCPAFEELIFPPGLEEIGWGCFNGCVNLRRVVFPDSLKSVGGNSFKDCPLLEEVVLPEHPLEFCMFNKGRESFTGSPWRESLPRKWIRSGELMRDLDCQEEYTVPSGVTEIGPDAFTGNRSIRKLMLGDQVKVIRANAFAGSAISEIRFGRELRKLGEYAFSHCENLQEVDLPRGLTELKSTFYGCSSLRRVTIPSGVKKIQYATFYSCVSLEEVTLPDGLERIESNAFAGCTSLKKIRIPDTVKMIGMEAFANTALTSIHLPADVDKMWLKDAFPRQTTIWIGSQLFREGKQPAAARQSDPNIKSEYKLSEIVTLALAKGFYYTEQEPDDGDDHDGSMIVSGSISRGKYKDPDSGETKYRDDVTFTLIDAPEENVPFEDIGFVSGPSCSGDLPDTKFVVMTVPVTLLGITITSHIFECVRKQADGSYLDLRDAVTLSSSDDAEKEIAGKLDYMLKVLGMFRENGTPVEIGSLTGKKLWKKLQKAAEGSAEPKKKTKKRSAGNNSPVISYSGRKAVIQDELTVEIPDGMTYSTNKLEIGENKELVFLKEEKNDYYMNVYGEEDFSIAVPYGGPESLTLQFMDDFSERFGGRIVLSDQGTRDSIYETLKSLPAAVPEGELTAAKLTDDLYVYYIRNDENHTNYYVVTSSSLYWGQIWINDDEDPNPYIEQWLSRFSACQEQENEKTELLEFGTFTYEKGRTEEAGGLIVPVPDQMYTVSDARKKLDSAFSASLSYDSLDEEFLFLAISETGNKGFKAHWDAMFSISIASDSVQSSERLGELWTAEKGNEREKELADMVYGVFDRKYRYSYKNLGEKLDVLYLQVDENEPGEDCFCGYLALFLFGDTIYQAKLCINAQENKTAFERALEDWVSRVRPADDEVAASFQRQSRFKALGSYAGKNGKVDAVKVSRLFHQDVLFFNDSDLKFDGKHHQTVGMQMNAEKTKEYPWIVENLEDFGPEVMDLLNYVEQNEKLFIPKKKIHKALLPMTRNDPATGVTFMDFCAWHLLAFAETDEEKHDYLCMVEPNLINGIPDAYGYISEFLKTLLAYNGYTGDFSITAALTVSADLLANRIHDPVPGASHAESVKTIEVKGE